MTKKEELKLKIRNLEMKIFVFEMKEDKDEMDMHCLRCMEADLKELERELDATK